MSGSEEIIRRRQPLVKIFLNDWDGNLSRLDDSGQSCIAGEHVEELFLEHGRYALCQGGKSRMAQHGELVLPVSVDELGIGEKIEPVGHRLIERT